MDIYNIEPTTLTQEQAKGLATDYTQAHEDVVNNIRHVMQSAATDTTIDNEDLLATLYKPVVKVATKNTANNETRLSELCDLLIQSANTQVVTNHGSLKNIQKELAGVLGYDNQRTGGTVSEVVGVDAGFGASPANTNTTGIITPTGSSGGSSSGTATANVGNEPIGVLDSSPIPGTIESGGTISEGTIQGKQFSITDILGIPSPIPSPIPTPTPSPLPGVEILPFCPVGVNLRPVTFPNGQKACLGDDGNLYPAECCKPVVITPPSCVDETTTGGGNLPPTPGPNPLCPKPSMECPEGLEWVWNDAIQKWQCLAPQPKPEPPPKPKPCQDWYDQINLNLAVECRDLPQDIQDKLKQCGFKVCDFKKVDKEGKDTVLGSLYGSLSNLWDWQNGLPQSFANLS